ncbi:MAG TPA: hypothetical protein VGP93_08465, partial [Polyangiaceae bacterium]|nr:hypothetical protein [Polyangiaceae bacterium]
MVRMRRCLVAAAFSLALACSGSPPQTRAPGALVGAAAPQPKAETFVQQGERSLRESHYPEAAKAFRAALAQGERGAVELDLAEVFLETGRYEEAEKQARAAAVDEPALQ